MKPIDRERKRTFRRWSGRRWKLIYDYRGRFWWLPDKDFLQNGYYHLFLDHIVDAKQQGLYGLTEKGIRR